MMVIGCSDKRAVCAHNRDDEEDIQWRIREEKRRGGRRRGGKEREGEGDEEKGRGEKGREKKRREGRREGRRREGKGRGGGREEKGRKGEGEEKRTIESRKGMKIKMQTYPTMIPDIHHGPTYFLAHSADEFSVPAL